MSSMENLKKKVKDLEEKKESVIEQIEGYLKNEEISFNERYQFFLKLPLFLKYREPMILGKRFSDNTWIDACEIRKGSLLKNIKTISDS